MGILPSGSRTSNCMQKLPRKPPVSFSEASKASLANQTMRVERKICAAGGMTVRAGRRLRHTLRSVVE